MTHRPTEPAGDSATPLRSAELVARLEGRIVGRLVLGERPAIVGSDPSCDLPIDHPTVSRRHLEVSLGRGGVQVNDLGSTNGTRYLGAQVAEALVPLGAALLLGSAELRVQAPAPQGEVGWGRLRTRSPVMARAMERLGRVAASDSTVLLEGETGTGKEVTARSIHESSARRAGPFEIVDCGALAPALAGSELFGHVRGAFTGADRDREGAFERAASGTLLLDEIGELPLELQPLLLRALESREIRRVGDGRYRPMDARIVAATHRDLRAESTAGRFREDLWHRLSVVRVRLPPLRERPEDVPLLAQALLDSLGARAAGVALSPQTLAALQAHRWPGNVRELRNVIEAAVTLGEPEPSIEPPGTAGATAGDTAEAPEAREYREARRRALDLFERDFVTALLERCGGNVSRAAEEAGVARPYLHRLLKKHGVKSG
ncbi:MAG TPA: sigma 54-interacting transcriptional regulator [Myxococcaceae bacterium]|nr:sigma 54-interacting transcriptional regulator [Myxococcaceae bacterium]